MDGNMMTDGVISLDDRPAIAAIDRANKGLDSHESKTRTVLDRAGREWQVYGEGVVRVSDKSKTSLDRLLGSMQKQAEMAGKTGVERMIAQRDQLIAKWGKEEQAVQAITKSYEKLIAAESGGGGSGFNARYAFFGLKDIAEGRTKFALAEVANELTRLSGTAFGVGIAAAAVGGVAFAAVELKKKFDELAEAPARIAAEFGRLNDSTKMVNDEMELSNVRLENQIAKLEHRPENALKQAIHEAAVEADHLAEKLDKGLHSFLELMQKNAPGAFARIVAGHSGVDDINQMVGGKTGFGGLIGDVYSATEAGGNPAAVLASYRAQFQQKLDQTKRTQQEQSRAAMFVTVRSETGMSMQVRSEKPAGYVDPRQDERIEILRALLTQIDAQAKSYGLEKEHATLTAKKDQLEAVKADRPKVDEELKRFREEARVFERRGDEAELSAIGKVYYQRDLLLEQAKKLKGVEADIAGIRKSADEQAGSIFKKDWDKFEEHDQTRRDQQSRKMAAMLGPSKEQMQEWEDGFRAQDQVDSINLQSRKEALNRQASQASKMVGLSGATGMDAIRATYEIRVDLAKQLAVVEAERISKEDTAAKRMEDSARARAVLEKDIAEAQQEALIKQLELQKQQMDTLKKSSEGLWHTLLTNPSNFPKQLGSTIHEAVIKPVADGMASMTANVLHPIIYGADGAGGLAGMFKGAFGGKQQDPMKMATDMNTAVTSQNSAALATLTAIIAGAMGMAAPAIAMPAMSGGISLPSISAPAVAGAAMSSMTFGGGASSGSGNLFDLPTINRSNPLAMVLSGGGASASSSADMASMSRAAGGSGFNPLAMLFGGGRQGGAATGGGSAASGIAGMLKNFKGTNWGGLTRSGVGYNPDGTMNDQWGNPTDNHVTGVNGIAGAALGGGGMMLASAGLLGANRGTWGGIAEGTAGGASIGYQQGGTLGALIGGAAGFAIGGVEKLLGILSPETKAKQMVKQIYGLGINDATAKQIASIATQKYGGNVSVAVRDPDVRKMLMLYAQGTGQKFPLSATTPQAGSLAEMGGNLYQQATYGNNGVATTFQSNLPVLGGLGSGNNYPTPGGPAVGAGMGPLSISMNIGGADAASFLTGQVVTPGYVADASMVAQNASYGRVQASANTQLPGLTTGT